MIKQGKLIAIEGPDGAGKSTQIRMLQEVCPNAVFTREPGGTPYAERIRALIFEGEEATPQALFMLFWAARMEHLQRLILPAIREGKTVVTDRFDLSTFAYQLRGQFNTRELDALFWQIRQSQVVPFVMPYYIYLDIPVEIAIERLKKREGEVTHFDTRPIDFHERVRDGGHMFLGKMNVLREGFYHIIDACRSADIVHQEIVKTLNIIHAAE